MTKSVCCFTGHRQLNKAEEDLIAARLTGTIREIIRLGINTFLTGGALGFDTICALAILNCKKEFPDIKHVLVLPCQNQTRHWNEDDIKKYNLILKKADKVIYTSKNYFNGCMHKRNRFLVDNSGVCICYLKKRYGGTFYTVNYAEKIGIKIINLAADSPNLQKPLW
ncbi:MAG: DUF1273 domain-containing protein [Oscillospiraceae bacterium]|nr:DUF1273 domain-containing protein [Oscillospiraceae bacterium]